MAYNMKRIYMHIYIHICIYTYIAFHIYETESLCCTAEINTTILNQLYINKINLKSLHSISFF